MPPPKRRAIHECHVGLVGHRRVGKTAVVNRVFEQLFIADEDITYDPTYEGPPRRLYVVDDEDVAYEGFEFRDDFGESPSLTCIADKCDVLLMVFSLTDRESLEKLKHYQKAVLDARKQNPIPAIVVGNKCDITKGRAVNNQEAEAVAQELGCKYFEISAKEDINVDDAMRELAREKWQRDKEIVSAAEAAEVAKRKAELDAQKKNKPKRKFYRGKGCVVC